jgi:hypothetical protein
MSVPTTLLLGHRTTSACAGLLRHLTAVAPLAETLGMRVLSIAHVADDHQFMDMLARLWPSRRGDSWQRVATRMRLLVLSQPSVGYLLADCCMLHKPRTRLHITCLLIARYGAC